MPWFCTCNLTWPLQRSWHKCPVYQGKGQHYKRRAAKIIHGNTGGDPILKAASAFPLLQSLAVTVLQGL